MKQAIIVHGWAYNPGMGWYPYVKKQLESNGFHVKVPEMPSPEHPKIKEWVNKLKEIIPSPNHETYFIGHSIGCQTILRYLQELPEKTKVGKIIFVAPWFHLQNLEGPESEKIVQPWLETSMDFSKINNHITKLTAIFSDNDPWVPVSDKEIFRQLLGAKIIVEHNKGHFAQDDGVTELQQVVDEIVTT
ncbi:MAG: alpha/beta fold hydrolase [Nanoarchaeota archaeon]